MITKQLPTISNEIPNDNALVMVLNELFDVSNAMCVYANKTKMSKEVCDHLDAIQAHVLFAKLNITVIQHV